VRIADSERGQQLTDTLKPDLLHRHPDRYARLCCPGLDVFEQTYHWSTMQAEYSTDLVFKSEQILRPLYEQLSREAVLSVRCEQVATFLGKKTTPQLATEIGSRLSTRIEGACSKAIYRRRNEIERLFRRLKGFRRIFSRFEELVVMFTASIRFAMIADALR
jgi:transposase